MLRSDTQIVLSVLIFDSSALRGRIDFLLDNGFCAQDVVDEHRMTVANLEAKGRKERPLTIFTTLDRLRVKLLDRTCYSSGLEFAAACTADRHAAFERLFGECVNSVMISHLDGEGPEEIYRLHKERPYDRLMDIALYLPLKRKDGESGIIAI